MKMSKFITQQMHIECADDKDDGLWILSEPLSYYSDIAHQVIVVPAGFHTDLASVPRLPIIFLLCGDSTREASVIHDYLYTTHIFSRKISDSILKEASEVTDISLWRRNLMWFGVRIGGWYFWNNRKLIPGLK
jgi:hypothetical protein